MLILAIETSVQRGSVALLDDTRLVAVGGFDPPRRAAQWLVPAISDLLSARGAKIRDVELVAVNRGPGSFTGLRIGVATAKTLAYALDRPLVGVGTFETIAAQVARHDPTYSGRLAAGIGAERGDVCAALFEVRSGTVVRQICAPELFADERLGHWATGAMVAGPFLEGIDTASLVNQGLIVAHPVVWQPTAQMVGEVGLSVWRADGTDERWSLAPVYARPSAADERREAIARAGQPDALPPSQLQG